MNWARSTGAKLFAWWCLIENCGGMTTTDRRNYRRFFYWVAAWGLISLAASFILQLKLADNKVFASAIIAVPIILALFTLRAYQHFFKSVDELTQRIQLEGLKFGFALGVFVIPAYEFLEMAGIRDARTLTPWAIMIIGYLVGQVLAVRRYR